MRIDGGPGEVRLRTGDGRTLFARTPEELLSRELGYQVPVSVLRYWILGRPAPDVEVQQVELDGEGHVQRMLQAGWDVHYGEYTPVDGGALPRLVEVRGPSLELKLLMTGWTAS
jgi:outer membrane lipoprotein LolB